MIQNLVAEINHKKLKNQGQTTQRKTNVLQNPEERKGGEETKKNAA